MIVPAIVQQHVDDAASLGSHRMALVNAPHATLRRLHRFDRRLVAHLDGLRIAGEQGWSLCEATLETPSPGAVFAVAVRALEDRDETRLVRIVAMAQAVRDTSAGLFSAFGWMEGARLRGVVARLLGERDGFSRLIGVAACAMHRVDPGMMSARLRDTDRRVRARALRAAGELGRRELVSQCADGVGDADRDIQFWAAWAAVLLGDRNRGLAALTAFALGPGVHRSRAFRLALQAMSPRATQGILQQLTRDPKQGRWLLKGCGIVGDPVCVPWLITRMVERNTARLAGEAFALIAGVDLGATGLDRPAPENFHSGPNDDPADPDVEMDPDEGLPWPDPQKVDRWWAANGGRFHAGTRYFVGAPVTREHCIDVLANGRQCQRMLAAGYLCLLDAGTPLFNTSAPAWRQERRLQKMG